MGTLSLAIVSISISIAIGDGTETRSSVSVYVLHKMIFQNSHKFQPDFKFELNQISPVEFNLISPVGSNQKCLQNVHLFQPDFTIGFKMISKLCACWVPLLYHCLTLMRSTLTVMTLVYVSGFLPVNAHGMINILYLNYINKFVSYFSAIKLSNLFLECILLHIF